MLRDIDMYFFFKQKTAYEMRISDWSSDVCSSDLPKYLNSPDTPLFDKGRVLYNLDKASPASRQTNRIVVVEGYMDVIALAEAGIADAVAPLGTALTEAQLALIWRMVPVPILCFDGDAAGQKAAMRAAMRALPLLRPGFSLSFATLPAGQDPDDIVRARGRSEEHTSELQSLMRIPYAVSRLKKNTE